MWKEGEETTKKNLAAVLWVVAGIAASIAEIEVVENLLTGGFVLH